MTKKKIDTQERYIFVSYKHEDKARVFPIVRQLRRSGYRVWCDEELHRGHSFNSEIMQKLGGSFVIMPFLSEMYLKSEYCKKELRTAKEWGKYVFPIFLEDITFEERDRDLAQFCEIQGLVLRGAITHYEIQEAFDTCPQLRTCHDSQSVYAHNGDRIKAPKTRETKAPRSKKPLIFILITLLLIVAGFGAWYVFLSKIDYDVSAASSFVAEDTAIPMSEYETLPEAEDNLLENDPDYEVTYVKRSASASYSEWCTLGANNDILYPGALLNLVNDEIKPLSTGLTRRPVTLSANLES